jgi:hypothetical protein
MKQAIVLAILASTLVAAETVRAADDKEAPKRRLKGEFGEGFGVESHDGAFGMNLRARAQVRFTVVAH